MFVYKDNGPAVALIPKCGSLSIRQMLPNVCALTPDEARARGGEIIAFTKDPFERNQSNYQYFSDLRERGRGYTPKELPAFNGYEEFIDMTFEVDDAHWRPLVSFLKGSDGKLVVTRVHRLADLASVWPRYYDTPVVYSHQSTPRQVNHDYRSAEIRCKYAEDFAL